MLKYKIVHDEFVYPIWQQRLIFTHDQLSYDKKFNI